MKVGKRIAKLRASHGESLRDAAMRTGVSHTTIARIEKGEVTGSLHRTLKLIADGYGVSMEFLLNGKLPDEATDVRLRLGTTDGEWQRPLAPEKIDQYIRILRKAMEHQIEPRVLDTAVDLLTLNQAKLAGVQPRG